MTAKPNNRPRTSGADAAFDRTVTETCSVRHDGVSTVDEGVQHVERYRVRGEVARGGLGCVLLAHDERLHRDVAVKELLTASPTMRERFQREVEITARLQHPGIVPVYDAGSWDAGEPYYVMKLLSDGRTLKAAVSAAVGRDGRLALLPNVIAAADAIAYAHSLDIIHRDLKPSNILVGPFGETVVIDWGLAKQLGGASDDAVGGGAYRSGEAPDLTAVGTILGTPQYMAPEQARGEAADKRADVYSLGALLYYVFGGVSPFEGMSSAEIVGAHRARRALSLPLEMLPGDVAAIVRKAIAVDPEDRYADAGELVEDLRRFQTGELVRAQDYSIATLLWRWAHRHRALLTMTTLFVVGLATMAIVGVRRIANARDAAEAQRSIAVAKRNELILLQARSSLEHDPTMAVAWLKTYPLDGSDWHEVQTIAAEAAGAGVAAHLIPTGVGSDSAFLPDGKSFIVVGGAGAVPRVSWWDIDSERMLGSIDMDATGVKVSGDGRRVAIGGLRGDVAVWDLANNKLRQIERWATPTEGLAISSDGAWIAASTRGAIRLWNVDTGVVQRWARDGAAFDELLFSPGGRTLFAAGADGAVLVVDIANGRTRTWMQGNSRIGAMALSQDGGRLVTGADDGVVRLWDVASGTARVVDHTAASVTHLDLMPSGDALVAVGSDRVVTYAPLDAGAVRRSPAQPDTITQLVVAGDGSYYATSDSRGRLQLWDPATGEASTLLGHAAVIQSLAMSRDGTLLSSGMDDETRVWPRTTLPPRPLRVDHLDGARMHVAFSPDGKQLATEGGTSVDVCDVPRGRCRTIGHHAGLIYGITWSADGSLLASAGWDGTARVWNLGTGEAHVFATGAAIVQRVAFSHDGRALVTASSDGAVATWRLTDGNRTLIGTHVGAALTAAVSPTGSIVVSGGEDRTVQLWDLSMGEHRVLGAHDSAVDLIAFSHDGRQVASGSRSGEIELWEVATRTRRTIGRHRGRITALAFSSDDARLVTASWDGSARAWDLATAGRFIALNGHRERVRHAAFSPDGTLVATASDDRTVRLWNLVDGSVEVLRGNTAPVRYVAFSPDGALLAAASNDTTVRIWRVTAARTPAQTSALAAHLSVLTNAVTR